MSRYFLPAIIAAALPVMAFAETSATDSISRIKYACADDKALEVIYVNTAAGNSYAILSQMDAMIPMEIIPMASGANYKAMDENDSYKLYTKGEKADLVKGEDVPVLSDCKEAK